MTKKYERRQAKSDHPPLRWQEAPDLLTTGQVARLANVSTRTVANWLAGDKIPATRLDSGHHRIKKDDLRRHLGLDDDEIIKLKRLLTRVLDYADCLPAELVERIKQATM